MRLFLALRLFFQILFSGEAARRVRTALEAPVQPAVPATPQLKPVAKPAAPSRSEALTLLAALQREARFIDFIQEPLTGYSDAQIGAVSRQVHDDCAKTLARLFELRPVHTESEGAPISVPPGFDAGRLRLTGNVAGEPPFSGKLVHHGWEAAKCQLPAWSGSDAAARIVAPAEVELA